MTTLQKGKERHDDEPPPPGDIHDGIVFRDQARRKTTVI